MADGLQRWRRPSTARDHRHAANRSLDDPSVALVYHQAESFDTLQAFLEDDELVAAMKDAGVTSEPEISYHTGGSAKFY